MTDVNSQSSQNNPDGDEELSPEALGVIKKARRSFAFSIAILLLGFVAIAGALVYRAIREDNASQSRYDLAQISLPAGAQLISSAMDGDVLVLTIDQDGAQSIRFVSLQDGSLLGEIAVE